MTDNVDSDKDAPTEEEMRIYRAFYDEYNAKATEISNKYYELGDQINTWEKEDAEVHEMEEKLLDKYSKLFSKTKEEIDDIYWKVLNYELNTK